MGEMGGLGRLWKMPKNIERRKFFQIDRYTNKVYLRIGSLIVEAGWYSGEAPCLDFKTLEWFAEVGEVTVLCAQAVKAVLCVSWDYGR